MSYYPIEAYALPMLHGEDPRGQPMRVLFTDDERVAREPVFLKRRMDRFWAIIEEPADEYAQRMRNVAEWQFPDWETPVAKVPPGLASGVQFYAADVLVPPRILRAGYNWQDINAGILEIEFDGAQQVRILDTPHPDKIARKRLKRMRERDARRVDAQLVQANSALFSPGEEGYPCLVLITFDRHAPRELLEEVAELMGDVKNTKPADPDLRVLADIVTDETYHYHHRDSLPLSVTEGYELFAAGLWLHRPFLRHGYIRGQSTRVLPCLAEPGPTGGIELLPYFETDTYSQ
jgi:hypothetical protein